MRFVTDTHCLFWYLTNHPRLSLSHKQRFDHGAARSVVIPTIALAELLYLSHKVSLPLPFAKTLDLLRAEARFEIAPLSLEIIQEASSLQKLEIHDLLIVATARHLDLPLMTADQESIASGLVETL